MICSICGKTTSYEKGASVPAQSNGWPDESRVTCKKCKPVYAPTGSTGIKKEVQKVAYDPKKKSINSKIRDKNPAAFLQPWEKKNGKTIPNEKFYEHYGGDRAKEKEFNRDPELAQYMQKKYPTKR